MCIYYSIVYPQCFNNITSNNNFEHNCGSLITEVELARRQNKILKAYVGALLVPSLVRVGVKIKTFTKNITRVLLLHVHFTLEFAICHKWSKIFKK